MDWNELRNQLMAACDRTKKDLDSIRDPSAPFTEAQAVAFCKGLCCLMTDPPKERSKFREHFLAECENVKTDLESIPQDPSASLTEAQAVAFCKGLYLNDSETVSPSGAAWIIKGWR